MQDYRKNGFLYRAGTYLNQPLTGRWADTLIGREREINLGGEGSITLSQEAAEAFTVSWVEMMTAHPITLETLDRVIYLCEEARISHPDSAPWSNGPQPVDLSGLTAEFVSFQPREDRTDPDGDFPEVAPHTDDDAPEA